MFSRGFPFNPLKVKLLAGDLRTAQFDKSLMFGGQSRDLRILKLWFAIRGMRLNSPQRLPAMRSTQFFTSPSQLFSHGHPSSPVFLWLVPSKDGSPPKIGVPLSCLLGGMYPLANQPGAQKRVCISQASSKIVGLPKGIPPNIKPSLFFRRFSRD